MLLSEIEYPLRLCVEMLHYSTFSCGKMQHLQASEIKSKLAEFFGEEMVEQAVSIVSSNDS